MGVSRAEHVVVCLPVRLVLAHGSERLRAFVLKQIRRHAVSVSRAEHVALRTRGACVRIRVWWLVRTRGKAKRG